MPNPPNEVKEIKEGYRIALTYNLTLENAPKKISIPSKTPSYDALIQSLRAYFTDEGPTKEKPSRQHKTTKQWVYLLDHSYTQKGLSWTHLKNRDSLRAEALKAAGDALDLEISMALADVRETWDCEMDERRYRYYEEEEEDDYDEDNVDLTALIDSETVLEHWIDREGNPLDYKECSVSSREICWTKASDKFEPFESEYEGFMGNYGNTMDRWYHRAAIILWRKSL